MKHTAEWILTSVGTRGFPQAARSLLTAIAEAAGSTAFPRFVGDTGVLLLPGLRVAVSPRGLEFGRKGASPRVVSLAAVAKDPEAVLHAILETVSVSP